MGTGAAAGANGVTVRGVGRVALPADEADVTLGVDVVRPTAAEARDVAADAMSRVVAAVRARGHADADIRTADLSLAPEIEYRPDGTSRRVGFRLANRVAVRVRDVAAVAATVDAAIEAGATSLEGVAFRAANPEAARREALAGAVEDAMASAHRVARASGLVLGSIRSIRELDAGGPVPMARLALMEAKAADTPVLPGTTEVTASVEVSWDVAADRAV